MVETSRTIDIQVNGDQHLVPTHISLEDLLRHLNRDPHMPGVALAVNDSVVRRADWPHTLVRDDDRIEIITASQGG